MQKILSNISILPVMLVRHLFNFLTLALLVANLAITKLCKKIFQIFHEFLIDSKVILKSVMGPYVTCQEDLPAWLG